MVIISGAYGKLKTWVKAQLHTDHQSASTESAEFKDVNIAIGEAYKQGNEIILRIKALNIFAGIDTGKVTTGNRNCFYGCQAGYSNINGDFNIFIGYQAGFSNINGDSNTFIGDKAGRGNISGCKNFFMGDEAGYSNISAQRNIFVGIRTGHATTTGSFNIFIGYQAGLLNIGGQSNIFIGDGAGYSNVGGNKSIFIGDEAGHYETGTNKLIFDNAPRANEADGRIKALIYGVFDTVPANQLVRLNAILELTSIKNGSTQANAGAAINEVWKTNGHASLPDNVLMIGV